MTDADAEEREHVASSVNYLMLQSKHFVIVTHAITFVVYNLKEYKLLLEWPPVSQTLFDYLSLVVHQCDT